jgi:hypothetical protein
MVKRLTWTVWEPKRDNGEGNGTYNDKDSTEWVGGGGRKLVLFSTSDYDRNFGPFVPHFSLDLRTNGKIYQHSRMDRPAYRLAIGFHKDINRMLDANKEAGKTLQVCILGWSPALYHNREGAWFTDAKYKRLVWFLERLCNAANVPKDFPYGFGVGPTRPDYARRPWTQYHPATGILGEMHATYDIGQIAPGQLNTALMKRYFKDDKITGGITPQGDTESIREEDPAASDPDDDGYGDDPIIPEVRMDDKPFRFNPPLHRLLLPKRVDFTGADSANTMDLYLDERSIVKDTKVVSDIQVLRLGRIIQHELAAGGAALNEQRMGFRFLYNPTSITVAASRNDSVIIDPRSTINSVISGIDQNFQTIRFQLFLNRMPDVLDGKTGLSDYIPGILQEDFDGVRKFGTHWDLEILYRVCTGVFNLEDRGKTADIGIIVPSNARLLLGPVQNWFGFVESIAYTDKIFSRSMVPVLTQVDIVFRRHVDMGAEALQEFADALAGAGVGGGSGGGDSGSGSGGDGAAPPTGTALSPLGLASAHPITAKWSYSSGKKHRAYDISMPIGTPMTAGVKGVVADCNDGVENNRDGYNPGSGAPSNWILIHTTYKGEPCSILLQHLNKGLKVSKGSPVKSDSLICESGNTGNSTGPHLHLAVSVGHVSGAQRYKYLNGPESGCIFPPTRPFKTP